MYLLGKKYCRKTPEKSKPQFQSRSPSDVSSSVAGSANSTLTLTKFRRGKLISHIIFFLILLFNKGEHLFPDISHLKSSFCFTHWPGCNRIISCTICSWWSLRTRHTLHRSNDITKKYAELRTVTPANDHICWRSLSCAHKTKRWVCEQVLTVILVRRQHMPACPPPLSSTRPPHLFQKGGQEKAGGRGAYSRCPGLSPPVISCHCGALLMTDPETKFISLSSHPACKYTIQTNPHWCTLFFVFFS